MCVTDELGFGAFMRKACPILCGQIGRSPDKEYHILPLEDPREGVVITTNGKGTKYEKRGGVWQDYLTCKELCFSDYAREGHWVSDNLLASYDLAHNSKRINGEALDGYDMTKRGRYQIPGGAKSLRIPHSTTLPGYDGEVALNSNLFNELNTTAEDQTAATCGKVCDMVSFKTEYDCVGFSFGQNANGNKQCLLTHESNITIIGDLAKATVAAGENYDLYMKVPYCLDENEGVQDFARRQRQRRQMKFIDSSCTDTQWGGLDAFLGMLGTELSNLKTLSPNFQADYKDVVDSITNSIVGTYAFPGTQSDEGYDEFASCLVSEARVTSCDKNTALGFTTCLEKEFTFNGVPTDGNAEYYSHAIITALTKSRVCTPSVTGSDDKISKMECSIAGGFEAKAESDVTCDLTCTNGVVIAAMIIEGKFQAISADPVDPVRIIGADGAANSGVMLVPLVNSLKPQNSYKPLFVFDSIGDGKGCPFKLERGSANLVTFGDFDADGDDDVFTSVGGYKPGDDCLDPFAGDVISVKIGATRNSDDGRAGRCGPMKDGDTTAADLCQFCGSNLEDCALADIEN
jgi:hypothetical protein